MYKILSFDGGGIRGLITALIVTKLNRLSNGRLLRDVDAFAGTSTGSFIAACLANEISPTQITQIYTKYGTEIFKASWWYRFSSGFGMSKAKYAGGAKIVERELNNILGTKKFSDLKSRLLITSFNLKEEKLKNPHYRPIVWNNISKVGQTRSEKIGLVEACMQSSAAPTYFGIRNGYIDGGVWGNNPAMAVTAEVLRSGMKREDLTVLSIGTGFNCNYVNALKGNWGILPWVSVGKITDIMLGDATTGANHSYMRSLLGPNYHRIQPHLKNPIAMDDAKAISEMSDIGNAFDCSEALSWMQGFWL